MTEKPNEQPPPPSSWPPPITPELIQDLMKRKTWEDTLFHTPLVKKSKFLTVFIIYHGTSVSKFDL